ncbi:hypothetical protein, partial [Cylindrospermopsis raciborskii]|uniref:hypothetical protein n=1 Tax=Cylindrospermopsis raciborskii TaxID=77022 RepID=UPI001CA5EA1F
GCWVSCFNPTYVYLPVFRLKRRALVFLRENSEDFEGRAFRKSPSKYPHPFEITDSSFDGKRLPSIFY